MSHPSRALPPAQAPPPFDPPVLLTAKRVTGTVVQTPALEMESTSTGKSNEAVGDGEKTLASHNHILIVEHEEGKKAYLLQRKVGTTAHGSIRVGYVLKDPKAMDEGVWELAEPSEGYSNGEHQHEMVSVIIEEKSKVLSDDMCSSHDDGNTSIDHAAELSALQLVATHDPEGVGHVLGTANVACDQQHVYAITDYHREGSLFEYCAEVGCLGEPEARFFFRQILMGLETLQRVELCHRNLSLETVLLRGTTCTLAGLGSALRIPASSGIVHLIEPQAPCGSPQYVAPELLSNKPFDGYAIDLFAAGVMLFVMLLGSEALFVAPLPEDRRFQDICVDGNLKELLQRMESKHHKSFSVGNDALDLLQKMLRAEPKDRLSLSQIQQHAWVTQGGTDGATAPKSRMELSSGLSD